MTQFFPRALVAALSLMLIPACGNANGQDGAPEPSGAPDGSALEEMFQGGADAPVTLIEYASVTCGACKQFHETVYPALKTRYIETGKLKYVFREFPTPPEDIALAGFALARCAGPDRYFDVLDDLFEHQVGIIQAARNGAAASALAAVGERHGIGGEEAFRACINSREIRRAMADVILTGEEYGVNATPTLILQGEKLETSRQSRTVEGLTGLIDAELMALGLEPPAADGETADDQGESEPAAPADAR